MSNIKLVHSGGNSVSLTTPDSNPAANRTFKLPGADGTSGQAMVTDGSGALSFASVAGGKVLQAVTATSTSATFAYNTTFIDSGLSASITPSATSSKILVFVTQHFIVRRSSSSFWRFNYFI